LHGNRLRILLPVEGIDLRELEYDLVRQALARVGNNQSQAAKLLNMSRDSLRYRLKSGRLDSTQR